MPLKTCDKGHQFYKTSDCPTCPSCEKGRKPIVGFMSKIPAPARRALESKQIDSLEKLASFTELEILSFHGMGKSSIPKLKDALVKKGLTFKRPD